MKKYYVLSFLLILFTFKATLSFSQAGILDAGFGNGGKVVTAIGDSSSVANSVAVTTDGKIIVGGNSFVAGHSLATLLRYNSDGSIDSTFGTGGKAVFPVSTQSTISTIALQPDGKIVSGYSYPYTIGFLIVRFNSNGSLDSSFGNQGVAFSPNINNGAFSVKKVIIKPDGKIVAAGSLYTAALENYPIFAQYLPNGKIDSSFGRSGLFISDRYISTNPYYSGVFVDAVNDIASTTDGKIVSVLNPTNPIDPTGFLVVRLRPNGELDSTFGINGAVNIAIDASSADEGQSIILLPDGSLVVTGSSYPGPPTYATSIALVKYKPTGVTDSTFGTKGKVLTSISGSYTYSTHILALQDGSLLVSGYTGYPKTNFVLAKYLPNGTLDSSFGTNGIVITDFSGTDDISYSSVLQPDGKIVLAGSTGNSTSYNIALARYTNAFVYPLHLLTFTATKQGKSNLLQWQTAQEINTHDFEVESSGNGRDYSTIGFVNAGTGAYHFMDNKPLLGNNYYRLKMIDKNGSFTYSPVREITNDNSFTVTLYPNPAKDKLHLQVNSNKEQVVQWQVVSNEGKLVLSNNWTVQAGSSSQEIPVAALQKGTYYLITITNDKKQIAVKFEKL